MIAPGGTIGISGRRPAWPYARFGGGPSGLSLPHLCARPRKRRRAEVAAEFTCAPWLDQTALAAFADACDIVTFEFENVPVAPLAAIEAKLAPHSRALEIAQDRLHEKGFAQELGGKPAPYAPVHSAEDLARAIDRIGAPGILKTRADGYDGKGQWRINSARDADAIRLPDAATIYEGLVHFSAEFSVILVRGQDGEVRFWDSAENVHHHGILAKSSLPACPQILEQLEQARTLASGIAASLGYVGVLTCEFFATDAGPVFNEMAPRVHNSGHWTIEGAATSQFENHIRAICGLPLGSTEMTAPLVTMTNLVGPEALTAHEVLSDPTAHLHLYGKREAREGRKMGHVTWLGSGPK